MILSKKSVKGLFILLFITATAISSQAQLAVGTWQTHLSYNNVNQVAVAENKVFGVGSGALFSVDKADESVEIYSKLNGLNDNNVVKIAYSAANKTLLIVYANADIDLYTESGITNLPDLFRVQTPIDKTVNSVLFNGDYAYLACNFGILVVNLVKQEVADSYVIGTGGSNIAVLSTAILNGKIYALTANGIMQANLNDHNLANFQVWSSSTETPAGTNSSLATFGGNLWLLKSNNTVYQSTDGIVWNTVSSLNGTNRMQLDDQYLYFISDSQKKTIYYDSHLVANTISGTYPNMLLYDKNSSDFWMTAANSGLQKTDKSGQVLNSYKPEGPFDNNFWQMKIVNGKLFAVPGGAWAVQYNHPASIMMYENGKWSYIDGADIAAATGMPQVLDFVSIDIDPTDITHFFATSYGMGLYEFKDNKFYKWYNSKNSGVESIFPGQSSELYYQRLDGVTFDPSGYVLFTNCAIDKFIKYLSPSGIINGYTFSTTTIPPTKATVISILIDKRNKNRKWVLSARAYPGVFVYDDQGSVNGSNITKCIWYQTFTDQDNNSFYSENLFCATQDLNNQIWVGTLKGPIVIPNPDKAFDSDFTINRIKIPRNDGTNLADYLLGNEQVNAIAVDGANRKWIGTQTSGLYLVSENGQETLAHFTTDNSPMLSNTVQTLCLNELTGELLISTANGLISYQTDATSGSASFTQINAFPNPIRESYRGMITITGLVKNSIVKITDMNGNLVYQTKSNGGMATWDGNRQDGKRVNTGVYPVLCISEDGTQTATTKLLVIN
jgi:ligand-binding sensor domain-containing protein